MIKHHLSDSEIWRIQILGRYGFSYRLISKKVFNTEEGYKWHIAKALKLGKIRLRDYRNGETKLSKGVVAQCLRNRNLK